MRHCPPSTNANTAPPVSVYYWGVTVDCIAPADSGLLVRATDGSHVRSDMVIVGIGIVPAVEPLLAAGAADGNGVDVDDQCRTSLPDIYVIGDCAAHPSPYVDNTRLRVESVQNAND